MVTVIFGEGKTVYIDLHYEQGWAEVVSEAIDCGTGHVVPAVRGTWPATPEQLDAIMDSARERGARVEIVQ